ncbi:MAG: 50S ribosomal protein L19 [Pseudomonadota bacterium]
MDLIDTVNDDHSNKNVKNYPAFRTGDTVAVYARIREGEKSRVQVYQGVCIAIKSRNCLNGHFCVRKNSSGYGVERVFPFHSPNIEKIELVQRGKTRRAKLLFLRKRSGKSARISIDYDRGAESSSAAATETKKS